MKTFRLFYSCTFVALFLSSAAFGMLSNKNSGRRDTNSSARYEQALKNIAENLGKFRADEIARTAALPNTATLNTARTMAERDLHSRISDARIVWNEKNATPVYIEGTLLTSPDLAVAAFQPATIAKQFLSENSSVLGLRSAADEMQISDQAVDAQGYTHVRLQQTYLGVPVWGAEARVHIDPLGTVISFNGRYVPTPVSISSSQEKISSSIAASTAEKKINRTNAFSAAERMLLGYNGPLTEKIIFIDRQTQQPSLAWHVTVRPNVVDRWEYFIDANSGAVLFDYYNTCADGPATTTSTDLNGVQQTVHSYQAGGTYYLIDASRTMYDATHSVPPDSLTGAIWTITANNTDLKSFFQLTSANNSWSDASSVSSGYNAGLTYEYYRTTHNRNSIDDKGATMISVVHVTQNGAGMDNAYWNGKFMVYGDGAQLFKPLAGGLDVAGHEITHGVTENSAALVYLSQSGALNESMSDVFGCFVERQNWTIGETVCKPGVFPHNTLRDMADPHNGCSGPGQNGWQPAVMSEYQQLAEDPSSDNGGVHMNSGIPNHAAYIIAQAIGDAKAEKIYYNALTAQLTKNAQFIDGRLALVASATELYGASGAEVAAVKNAFDQVQIFDGAATPKQGDYPAVVGDEWILISNFSTTNDHSLYRVHAVQNPQASDFQQLTSLQVLDGCRPSVIDDGGVAVFVDASANLYLVRTDGAGTSPVELDNSGIWATCAASRDGNRLALTDTLSDAKIAVIDYSTTPIKFVIYKLHTPTSGQGAVSNTVQFAQTMDFDPAGEFVVYDNYNQLADPSGTTINYWDIGAIRVWDNAANTFGDSTILRVFPAQQEGVDIGNPVFSKNSPFIIAYDMIDNYNATSAVMGANLQTGATGKIADNMFGAIGYPTFSRLDNIVAFTTGSGATSGINLVGVDNTKIAASSAVSNYLVRAYKPVWYTIGTRPASVTENAQAPASINLSIAPNPVSDVALLTMSFAHADHAAVEIFDAVGRRVASVWNGNVPEGDRNISFNTTSLLAGTYFVTLRACNAITTRILNVMH